MPSTVPAPVGAVALREQKPLRLPPRDPRGRFIRRQSASVLPQAHHHSIPVLFVVSEMADFIKAGGLGDVASSLPRALRPACDVRVLIPGYPEVLQRIRCMNVVGRVKAHAGLPECRIGMTHQKAYCAERLEFDRVTVLAP